MTIRSPRYPIAIAAAAFAALLFAAPAASAQSAPSSAQASLPAAAQNQWTPVQSGVVDTPDPVAMIPAGPAEEIPRYAVMDGPRELPPPELRAYIEADEAADQIAARRKDAAAATMAKRAPASAVQTASTAAPADAPATTKALASKSAAPVSQTAGATPQAAAVQSVPVVHHGVPPLASSMDQASNAATTDAASAASAPPHRLAPPAAAKPAAPAKTKAEADVAMTTPAKPAAQPAPAAKPETVASAAAPASPQAPAAKRSPLLHMVAATPADVRAAARPVHGAPRATAAIDPQAYRLGTGDKLRVTVYGEPDLSGDFEVDSSGDVRMPLVGQVHAAGHTVHGFEQELTAKLEAGYLLHPRVSAEVVTYRPFFIIGEVNKPGQYPYVNGMSVVTAVALAGGYTYRADESDVYVRRDGRGHEIDLPANATTKIHPGDIVRVSERFF